MAHLHRALIALALIVGVGCTGEVECRSNCDMQFACGTGGSSYDRCIERCVEQVAEYNAIAPYCGDFHRNMKGCVGALSCDDASDWFGGVESAPCDEYHSVNRPEACEGEALGYEPISLGPA